MFCRKEILWQLFQDVPQGNARSKCFTAMILIRKRSRNRFSLSYAGKRRFRGTLAHIGDIDARISENAKGWRLDRIARMSLAIMRLCVYELLYTEVPTPIAINEAVELAKAYDGDDAPAFINGILNSIAVKSGRNNA